MLEYFPDHIADFLDMGGYGVYIWSAYGITFLLLLVMIITTILNHRKSNHD